MRKILIILVIIGCILGYGYWHSSTHASFYIKLNSTNVNKELKTIPKAEIIFMDSDGRVLAHGISDMHNYVRLIHPEVGDCHEVEKLASSSKEAKEYWQECFEQLSTWIAKWASKVHLVNLKTEGCLWRNIPVSVSESNSDWFLWWVPHPHIGGKPYSYFSISITVNEKRCGN